jgi:hypothetical protein
MAQHKLRTIHARRDLWKAGCGDNPHVRFGRAAWRETGREQSRHCAPGRPHHDVHVVDEQGRKLGGGRLREGVEGIARFHELAARHAEESADVVIGIETDRACSPPR